MGNIHTLKFTYKDLIAPVSAFVLSGWSYKLVNSIKKANTVNPSILMGIVVSCAGILYGYNSIFVASDKKQFIHKLTIAVSLLSYMFFGYNYIDNNYKYMISSTTLSYLTVILNACILIGYHNRCNKLYTNPYRYVMHYMDEEK